VEIAAPAHGPGQAERDPATWDHKFVTRRARICRSTHLPVFRSLEADAAPRAAHAHRAPEFRRYMLPTKQPAHKMRSGHRFDLLAQRRYRKPVNSRQAAAVRTIQSHRYENAVNFPLRTAPLASKRSNAFSTSERRKSEKISELRCRSWTEMRHPAADCCEKCIVARGGARFDFRSSGSKLAPGNNAVSLLTRSAATQ